MFSVKVIVLRLFLILLLAGIIGWEREKHQRPAGLRTHILVGIGSALLMMISISMVNFFPEKNIDPGRIAAQVVSGIGFLGAGTIIREGFTVKGLTTAASLWAIAAIGLATGGGFYLIAIVTTLLVYATLFFFSLIEKEINYPRKRQIIIIAENLPGIYGKIEMTLNEEKIKISGLNIERTGASEIEITCKFELPLELKRDLIIDKLMQINGIKKINWIQEKERGNLFDRSH